MRRIAVLVSTLILGMAGVIATPASSGAAAPPSPIGSFDGASARFNNAVAVTGWAADADALDQPIAVRLYLGTKFVKEVSTTDARPDVAARMHGVGLSTGWHATITPADIWYAASGTVMCAYAINVGAGVNNTLGCRDLRLSPAPSPYDPVGNLEVAATEPGLVHLRGWAGDPDGQSTTRLRVYFNGNPVGGASTSIWRPDVLLSLHLGPNTGFDLTLPSAPGPTFVCVYAENTGALGNRNSTVGCAQLTTPGVAPAGAHDPNGAIDGVQTTQLETGWAYDPDSSAPITVQLRKYFSPAVGDQADSLYAGSATTGLARPDAQAAFPQAGPNSGYSGEIQTVGAASASSSGPSAAATSPPNHFFVCAYAVNVGAGSNRFIGCRSDANTSPVH